MFLMFTVLIILQGYGIASQVMARDYYSVVNGEGTVERPNTAKIGVDKMVSTSLGTESHRLVY
jgi:hypothetical protein